MSNAPPPTPAEMEAILAEVGLSERLSGLPTDLGSSGRLHVYIFGDVVVKCDQSPDGRRALRERHALALMEGSGLPVPRLLGSGRWREGQGWVALSRLDGSVPADAALLAHRASPAVARQMGALCARLHAGPTPPGFGTWARGSTSLIEDHEAGTASVVSMARGSSLITPTELDRLEVDLARLRESVLSAPKRPVLVHRDVQARNILVDPSGDVCALLDFETAAGGDPAEDFSPAGLDWGGESFAAYCSGYAAAGGRLDPDAPSRVAHRVLNWVLVIYAYLGHIVPDYLVPAREAWLRIEAGELPDLSPIGS